MALIFMDGFEQSSTLNEKWEYLYNTTNDLGSTDGQYGRRPTSRGLISYGDICFKYFSSNYTTMIAGVAVYFTGSPTLNSTDIDIIRFFDGYNHYGVGWIYKIKLNVVYTTVGGNNGFYPYIDQSVTWDTRPILALNTWGYYELKCTFNGSSGSFELRFNNVKLCSGTNLSTNGGGANYANAIKLLGGTNYNGAQVYIDDVYVCDDSGTKNNDFLGDSIVTTIYPTSNGNYSQWTPSTGSNYQCIDELPSSNIDYVSNVTFDNKDSYVFSDVSGLSNIHGIQVNSVSKRDPICGDTRMKTFCRINNVDYDSSSEIILTDVIYNQNQIFENNPVSDTTWSDTTINSAEFGAKMVEPTFNSVTPGLLVNAASIWIDSNALKPWNSDNQKMSSIYKYGGAYWTQPISNRQPTYKFNTVKGTLSTIRFDGSLNQCFINSDYYITRLSSTNSATIFVVYSPTNPITKSSPLQCFFSNKTYNDPLLTNGHGCFGVGTVRDIDCQNDDSLNEIVSMWNSDNLGGTAYCHGTDSISGVTLFTFQVINGTLNSIRINKQAKITTQFLNGNLSDVGGAFNYCNCIGNICDASLVNYDAPLNGDLCEFMWYDRYLILSDLSLVETYLYDKWIA